MASRTTLASLALLAACGSATTPPSTSAPPASAPPPTTTAARGTPLAPHTPRAAIDVDGDGHADVVVESAGSQGAGVYLGGASPRLAPDPIAGPDVVVGAFGRDAIGVGDLDRNGFRDFVLADDLYHRVLVYLVGPEGAGDPTVIEVPTDGAPIPRARAASAGDVNEDGYDDLVVGSTNAIYLHLGSASGISLSATRIAGTGGYGASVSGGGDVNGDGHADVVVGCAEAHAVAVHLGDGHALRPATLLSASTGQQMGDDTAMVGDVNRDGLEDVVTSGYGGNGGWIFYGSRAGLGPTPTPLGATGEAGWSLWVSAAGDVDGDGFDDVVSGGYAHDGAFLYRGSASGLVPEPQRIAPLYPDAPWMYRVRGVGDVNGDGFADVVVDNDMAPRFLFLGRSTGLSPTGTRLDARPDPTAPPPYVAPPPVTFPVVENLCTVDADCERVQKTDDQCCPLCAQYVAATHAWARRVEAICAAHQGACAISCLEGPPPTAHCDAGRCALR